MENNRNYFVAIALSVLILIAWQFFYVSPKMEKDRIAAEQAQQAQQTQQQPGAQPAAPDRRCPAVRSRAQAKAAIRQSANRPASRSTRRRFPAPST